MSQDDNKNETSEISVSEDIHLEPSPFELGYQPESLPKISVPDLSDDVQGLTAEALAQVPTLTELVDEPSQESSSADSIDSSADSVNSVEQTVDIQDEVIQADTWTQGLQIRMGKLNQDIEKLNARLDRLDARNNTKV